MNDANEASNKRIMPPVYFLAAILVIAALHWFVPITILIDEPLKYAGLVVIIVGLIVVVAPARAFERHKTAIGPFEVSDALVTDGFYRYTRNPMYLGMAIILIGIAVLLGTLASLIPIPIFIIAIQQRFILTEEKMLAERFGDQYQYYCSSVRRWI